MTHNTDHMCLLVRLFLHYSNGKRDKKKNKLKIMDFILLFFLLILLYFSFLFVLVTIIGTSIENTIKCHRWPTGYLWPLWICSSAIWAQFSCPILVSHMWARTLVYSQCHWSLTKLSLEIEYENQGSLVSVKPNPWF